MVAGTRQSNRKSQVSRELEGTTGDEADGSFVRDARTLATDVQQSNTSAYRRRPSIP